MLVTPPSLLPRVSFAAASFECGWVWSIAESDGRSFRPRSHFTVQALSPRAHMSITSMWPYAAALSQGFLMPIPEFNEIKALALQLLPGGRTWKTSEEYEPLAELMIHRNINLSRSRFCELQPVDSDYSELQQRSTLPHEV